MHAGGLFISSSCGNHCGLSLGDGVKFENNVATGQGAGGAVFAVDSTALSGHTNNLSAVPCTTQPSEDEIDMQGSNDPTAPDFTSSCQQLRPPQYLMDAVQTSDDSNRASDGSYGPAVATMPAGLGNVRLITENLRKQAPGAEGSNDGLLLERPGHQLRWLQHSSLAVGKGAFFDLQVWTGYG